MEKTVVPLLEVRAGFIAVLKSERYVRTAGILFRPRFFGEPAPLQPSSSIPSTAQKRTVRIHFMFVIKAKNQNIFTPQGGAF